MNAQCFLLRTATAVKPFEARNVTHAMLHCNEAFGATDVEWRVVAADCTAITTTWHRFQKDEDTGITLTAVNNTVTATSEWDVLQDTLAHFSVENLQFMLARGLEPPMPTDTASEAALIAYLAE